MCLPAKKYLGIVTRLVWIACIAAALPLANAPRALADEPAAAAKPADDKAKAEPAKAKDVVEYETRQGTGKAPASDPKTDVAVAAESPTTAPTTMPAGMKAAASAAAVAMKNRQDSEHARQRVARLATAVERLKKEANDLDDFDKVTDPPFFQRPHPALSGWNGDMALDTLRRMVQPFTGNEYRDTYIRWHLMDIVKRGSAEDKEEMGRALIKLIAIMPDELSVEEKPDHRYEPPEIAGKFFGLWGSQFRTIGYPPFQRQVGAPEVYKYVSGDEASQIQKNLAEAETLRDKFKTIIDIGARQWNQRIRNVNWFIRQYRGELIYAVLQTGDPEMFKLVMATIDRHAKRKSGIAMDLLTYMYLAAFDGVLNLYSADVLLEGSKQLEASARAMEGFQNYGGYTRNFADYAFHMIYILRDGGGFVDIKDVQNMPTRKRRL